MLRLLDHPVLESILREKVHDNRFLRLIGNLLRAGYLEEWRYNATLSGSPQGAVLSPVLSNVYLDRLDRFVETALLPKHNRGDRRRCNPAWIRLRGQATRLEKAGRQDEADLLRRQMKQVHRGLGRHWRAGCSERRTPGSGRGGWKSAGIGNSLAAYSTSSSAADRARPRRHWRGCRR